MGLRDFASQAMWRLCGLLPIDRKKVVFSSYYGRGYSDSPKAIAEELIRSGEDLKLRWIVKDADEAGTLPEQIRPVPLHGVRRVYEMSTAGFWVDNCRKYERRKRRGQKYLQTWHGFALKRIEKDAADSLDPEYVSGSRRDAAQTDLMVSGSEFMGRLYRDSFWYDGEIAMYGTPRNDIFFAEDTGIPRKVHDFFSLPQGRRLLLYAPTFRADHTTDCYGLDAQGILQACEERFGGEWTALIRLHPNVAGKSEGLFAYDGGRIIDATAYADMQELLVAADLLITDYSSSMFDYALQGKPCVQFATDLEQYRADRNFYFELDGLPFPMAQSNEELKAQIRSFDEETYANEWKKFKQEQGIMEDGKASSRCADWILQHMKG